MSETFTLSINGIQVTARAEQTLLEVAREHGIEIPTICYHPATKSNGLCRMCVVEVEGMRLLQPACIVHAQPNMKIQTDSPRVHRARKTILELLASTADLSEAPEIQQMIQAYQAEISRFPEAEPRQIPPIDDNPMYVREYSKCILCWRCVQVCAEDAQYTYAINFAGRGYHTRIDTFYSLPMPSTTCVFCGQCVGVCPTDALEPKSEYLLEQGQYPFPFR